MISRGFSHYHRWCIAFWLNARSSDFVSIFWVGFICANFLSRRRHTCCKCQLDCRGNQVKVRPQTMLTYPQAEFICRLLLKFAISSITWAVIPAKVCMMQLVSLVWRSGQLMWGRFDSSEDYQHHPPATPSCLLDLPWLPSDRMAVELRSSLVAQWSALEPRLRLSSAGMVPWAAKWPLGRPVSLTSNLTLVTESASVYMERRKSQKMWTKYK